MSKQHTKDEKFVVCLYESAKKLGDKEASVNRYEAGALAHLQEKGVDAICKLLVQSNFIKKDGEQDVFLTPRGIVLAEHLINE
jgi:hypothetical protein